MQLGRFLPSLPRHGGTPWRDGTTIWLDGARGCVLGPSGGALRNVPVESAGEVSGALKALDSLIVAPEKKTAGAHRLTVLLGAGFVQYVVVPWQAAPSSTSTCRPVDWLPLARRQLVQNGVAGGEAWRFAIPDGPWGRSRLAAAVPELLCAGIQRLGKARGLRTISIEPAFTLGVATYARRIHEGAIAIVELEPAGAAAALAQIGFRAGGQWTGFIALPVSGALDDVLRDAGMLCSAANPEHVYVIASTGAFGAPGNGSKVDWWPAPWGAIE